MNRKEAIAVTFLLFGTFITGAFAMLSSSGPSSSTPPQTTSVDIEVLNVARESGIFIEPPTANFTAGFSFAPLKGFVQVTKLLFTVEWNQLSQGHIGDKFGVQLNGRSLTLTAPFVSQTTQVTILPGQDLRLGSNIVKITVIPVNSSLTTNYLLFEVRLTVEYTFMA